MRIREIIWIESFVDKIESKHGVSQKEVRFILEHPGLVRFVETGHVEGEDVYLAMGQTEGGRYLMVFFIHKLGGVALPISARQMSRKEKGRYARQKKG